MKRNRPGQLMDRGDGVQTAGPKNNDVFVYRPKVMNRPQRGNSTSVPNSDDAGNFCTQIILCCAAAVVVSLPQGGCEVL